MSTAKRGVGIVVNPKKAELSGRLQADPYRAKEQQALLERLTGGRPAEDADKEDVQTMLMVDRGYTSMGNGCFKRAPVFN